MSNKQILVTGASRGIGRAIAIKLATEGYELILHASTAANLETTIQQLPEGTKHEIAAADFGQPDEVKSFLSNLKKDYKNLCGIVSNAGITLDKSIAYQPEREIDAMIQINLKVPVLLGKLAMKQFLKTKEGVFINISSCVGTTGNAFQSVYAATKAGVTALSKSWAKEIGQLSPEHKVRFLSISPGFIETDMTGTLGEDIQSEYKKTIPANRFGKPSEVANLVAFLISDESPYINGSEVNINGGIL